MIAELTFNELFVHNQIAKAFMNNQQYRTFNILVSLFDIDALDECCEIDYLSDLAEELDEPFVRILTSVFGDRLDVCDCSSNMRYIVEQTAEDIAYIAAKIEVYYLIEGKCIPSDLILKDFDNTPFKDLLTKYDIEVDED